MTLKEYIISLGYKQVEVAKLTKINIGTLNRFLNGWENIARHHEINLMKLLKLTEKQFNDLKDNTLNA